MSVCKFDINMNDKCGNCKYFKLYDETGIYGYCISNKSKIRNKQNRSMLSRSCVSKERKKYEQ